MITVDYNQILSAQFQAGKQGYKRFFSTYSLIRSFFSTRWIINRMNFKLTGQLINIKGLYAYLTEHLDDIKDKKLTTEIALVEKAIRELSSFEANIERHLANDPELKPTYNITLEMLDVLYDVLRTLKKNSLKTPLTYKTEEAEIAVNQSQNTINKVLHGR